MKAARILLVAVGVGACALIWGAGASDRAPRLLLNTTSSVPVGLYAVDVRALGVGDIAVVLPPPGLAAWMASRHYLPMRVPLLKEVAATAGARVCGLDGVILIDGIKVGQALHHDRAGRPLRAFSGCQTLTSQEVFLFNAGAEASLDSRYFGPVARDTLIGRARPLWTLER
jgi:conjugative transfer signal peptidase TraF